MGGCAVRGGRGFEKGRANTATSAPPSLPARSWRRSARPPCSASEGSLGHFSPESHTKGARLDSLFIKDADASHGVLRPDLSDQVKTSRFHSEIRIGGGDSGCEALALEETLWFYPLSTSPPA
ncbi:hypothetical protein MHYP_G00284360 [Metynnis hypsauchen]